MQRHMAQLERATEIRRTRKRQRDALMKRHPQDVLRAILDPTPELATYKLANLFGTKTSPALIPTFGPAKQTRLYKRLNRATGWQRWHGDLRLGNLDMQSRRLLIQELIAVAPKAWKERLRK